MSALLKSKLGMWLAGILLLTVLSNLLYTHLIDKDSGLAILIEILLSSPWNLLLYFFLIPVVVGEVAAPYHVLTRIVVVVIGALINAFILYWLGFLLTKAFNYLSSRKPKP